MKNTVHKRNIGYSQVGGRDGRSISGHVTHVQLVCYPVSSQMMEQQQEQQQEEQRILGVRMKEVNKVRALSVTENIKVGTFLKRPLLPLGYDSHHLLHMTQSQVMYQKVFRGRPRKSDASLDDLIFYHLQLSNDVLHLGVYIW